jgi:hypothetical protein
MHTTFLAPRYLGIAPLLLIALLGCSPASDSAKPEAAAASAAPAAATAPAPSTDKAAEQPAPAAPDNVSAKLQSYITCYNKLDGRAHRTINRYASWVKDMKAGPTGNEKVIYGLYALFSDDVKECVAEFEHASAMRPALPALDSAGKAYIASLAAMDKLVADAYTYYDRENYKDDNFAKGKSMHGPLAAGFDGFVQASAVFSKALDVENDNLLSAQLAHIEKTEGRKLPYYQMALMAKAKQLADVLGDETFDAAAAAPRLEAFEAITDEAMAFVKPQKDGLPMEWSSFENSAEEFRKASKERFRRVRDNVPYSSGERMMLKPGSGWMVDGSAEKLVKAYNTLVDASNRM